jgi:glycine betaine/choline ABC-type transport system substrate-binding protein
MMRRLFVLLLVAAFSSCSGGKDRIVVGSKNFTENLLLGELLAQHIEVRTGLIVDRRLNLGGTFLCHQALLSGQIDVYPEYTGTALTAILEQPVLRDAGDVFRAVSSAYREKFDAEWMKPFGFNNTFAIVVTAKAAESGNLKHISDLTSIAPKLTIGFNFEFFERQDGYRGLIDAYDLSFAQDPKTMDMSLVYTALRDSQIDVGVGNGTDGLIEALHLTVLEDDKHYFPPYDAAAVVRKETCERHPAVRAALDELGGTLSEEEMRRWNHEIDGKHRSVAEVARQLRREKGLD